MTAYSTYSLYWNPVPSTAQDTSNATLFGQTLWTDYSTYSNAKCIASLLNTNNWTGFVNSTYADCAIGGPTIEMWVASYNAKGYTPLYCNNTNVYGYYVGNTDTPRSTSYDLKGDANTGYGDTLYFSHQERVDSCDAYWLASPNASIMDDILNVSCYGSIERDIYNGGYSNYDIGVRPVVCLNSEVTAIQDESTKVWKLSI